MYLGKTMRKALAVLLSAAMVFSSSSISPVMADTPAAASVVSAPQSITQAGDVLKFDFVADTSAAADGFIGVYNGAYSSSAGYGWSTGSITKKGGAHKLAPYWLAEEAASDLKDACLTYVAGDKTVEFQVDVPNGKYTVAVYAGESTNAWKTETVSVNGESLGTVKTTVSKVGTTATTGYATTISQLELVKEHVVAEENAGITVKLVGGSCGFINALVITCEELTASTSFGITYDANGGTGSVPASLSNLDSNTPVSLEASPSLTRDGYRFVGWSVNASATTGSVTYNYSADDANKGVVTLYAVWAKEYSLVYNSNGGDADTTVPSDSSKYIVGEKITLDTATKPTRSGYQFLGWAAEKDAAKAVSSLTVADSHISGGAIQVYAVWQAEGSVNLKFDFGAKGVADGFIGITTQQYDASVGYGFTNDATLMTDKGTNLAGTVSPTDEATFTMCKDYTYTEDAAGLAFRVDVKPGTYDVEVYAGLGGKGHQPVIKVNDKDLGKAVTAYPANESELLKSTTVTVKEGEYITVTSSGSAGRNMINGIIIKSSVNGAFSAPQNVTASSSATSVTISWDAVADADHYNIFRKAPSGNDAYSDTYNNEFWQIGSTTNASYIDPVVTCKEYQYYVVAVGSRDGGVTTEVSDPSEKVTSTIAAAEGMGTATAAETYTDRALVAAKAEEGVFVSWRLYSSDSSAISFTLERNGTTVYTGSNTSFLDKAGKAGDTYTLTASEGLSTGGESTVAWAREYQEFTLQAPANQTMPDGSVATYEANDMSVGDLDGDGQLELIVKWYPSNAQDNSNDGYTGTTILDAYDIDIATGAATLMWRIDLGLNIRSGAHYTQFQVWDFDGDGRAELICKTADGSTTYDGNLNETGHVGAISAENMDISAKGTAADYDFRSHTGRLGRIVDGDEYLTAFDGQTGWIIDTVNYVPFRGPYDEKTGLYDTTIWGLKNGSAAESLGYANRCDRFLSAVAYIDDGSAAAIFSRGYYDRTAITAWKLIGGKLVMQWVFDTPDGSYYAGQGNHGLGVNDVDGDGTDEIIFAGLVLNSDGTPRVNTQWGHGDAMHISDWNGDGKLEVYKVNEEVKGAGLYDPDTGEILWFESLSADTGRGVAADVDPRYNGGEMWHSVESHTHNAEGDIIYESLKPSQNFSIFWDGDLLKELFDSNSSTELIGQVQKWNYHDLTTEVILQLDGTKLNNGTKANPGLIADIYGDWREEIIVRDSVDNNKIRIYTTTIETPYSLPTFLENTAYREAVAWQNVAYNQPANTDYLLSKGLKSAVIVNSDRTTSTETLTWEAANDGEYGIGISKYQIYRASSKDALWADYTLVGEVDAKTLSFTDQGLKANTEYTYVVVAVVDGDVAYKSLPFSAKTALATTGVQDVEPITMVQDTPDYEAFFPATVLVVDTEGNEQYVDITWDYDTLKISEPGEKTVYGTIYGREEKVPVQVTVLKNKITGVEKFEDVYALKGATVALPQNIVLSMYNGVSQTATITWGTNYDVNTIGDYEVTGTFKSTYGESGSVTIMVHIAEDYIVSVEQPTAVILDFEESAESVKTKLPATVTATFAKDGRTEEVPVVWSTIDTTILDTVTVDGVVESYAGYAKLLVKVDYPIVKKFDFGLTTSPVEDGWIGVQAIQKGGKTAEELGAEYTAEKGYGFNPTDGLDGRNQSYTQEGLYSKNVYNDFLITSSSTTSSTFMVDVENGEYVVEMISGSTDKSTIKANIEGKDFSVGNNASTYEVGRFEGIVVEDGQMTIEFTSGNLSRVCAVIIHKVVESSAGSDMTAGEKVENAIASLPDEDATLTPYDVTRIDKVAEQIMDLSDAEKDAISADMIQKMDALYAKAHGLSVEVQVTVPAEITEDKKLQVNTVSQSGLATASGATEGVVVLEIVQQVPTHDTATAQLEFKATLTVNVHEVALKAPVIISLEIPKGVDLKQLRINHYSDEGEFLGTITKGNRVTSSTYVLEGRTLTFRTNGFSVFTLLAGSTKDDYDDYDDDYDDNYSNSSSSSTGSAVKPQTSVETTTPGKWVLDGTGWWYSYNAGGWAANKWEKVNGQWYYFNPDGYMVTGWVNTNQVWYYCSGSGAMLESAWVLDNGTWYYLNAGGSMATGWILVNGKWYYLNADGSMVAESWIQYKEQWYYLKKDGDMAVSETTPDGYTVDKDGIWR